jgi:hypothetical protein
VNTENLTLSHGYHDTPEEGMCLMEAVAFLAGESHSDEPACSCPILAAYAREINDRMGQGAEGDALRAKHLLPIATKLIGTRSTPEVERKRMYYFADRAVRLFAPSALEAVGLTERADALRALPEIVDERTARAARAAAWAAYTSAARADAAWVSAESAWDSADAARVSAAWSAADAACDAARAAADAAGWEQAAQVLAEACEIGLEGVNDA